MSSILGLARPEISSLQSYQPAARQNNWVRLNANESPWSGGDGTEALNRYPESRSRALTNMLADYLTVEKDQVLVTRGSDDAIDLLMRAFCRAGVDRIMAPLPAFGMYALCARIQGAGVIDLRLPRERNFSITREDILNSWRPRCKLVFLCSPNNPTGNLIEKNEIEAACLALATKSLVILDEAYIEFSGVDSAAGLTRKFPNLVVLRTMSKAHGLAASRVGALVASAEIVSLLNRILPPYPLPAESQRSAISALSPAALGVTVGRIKKLIRERQTLAAALADLPCVIKVWPSEGNFLLVQTVNASKFLRRCNQQRVLVRDCSDGDALADCVRVSVGSPQENAALLRALRVSVDAG